MHGCLARLRISGVTEANCSAAQKGRAAGPCAGRRQWWDLVGGMQLPPSLSLLQGLECGHHTQRLGQGPLRSAGIAFGLGSVAAGPSPSSSCIWRAARCPCRLQYQVVQAGLWRALRWCHRELSLQPPALTKPLWGTAPARCCRHGQDGASCQGGSGGTRTATASMRGTQMPGGSWAGEPVLQMEDASSARLLSLLIPSSPSCTEC